MTVSTNSTFLPKRMADAYFSGSFKILLVATAPTETEIDSIGFRSGITTEVVGSGYTAGGIPVTLTVGALDATNNRVAVTPTNLPTGWPTATIAAVGGWIYKSVGSPSTDELIAYVDFGTTVSSTAGNFAVAFPVPLYINR